MAIIPRLALQPPHEVVILQILVVANPCRRPRPLWSVVSNLSHVSWFSRFNIFELLAVIVLHYGYAILCCQVPQSVWVTQMVVVHQEVYGTSLCLTTETDVTVACRMHHETPHVLIIMERAKALIINSLFLQYQEVAYHVRYARRVLYLLFCEFIHVVYIRCKAERVCARPRVWIRCPTPALP